MSHIGMQQRSRVANAVAALVAASLLLGAAVVAAQTQSETESQPIAAQQAAPGTAVPKLGFSVGELNPRLSTQLQLPENAKGVVVARVNPHGPAAAAGLKSGDLIDSVNSHPVANLTQFEQDIREPGHRTLVLRVTRGEKTFDLTVSP